MTLRLTPEMLAAAYDMFRKSEPFKAWKLPPPHAIKFKVVRDPSIYADFEVKRGQPVIRVSIEKNCHLETVLATLAHEMAHLRQYLTGDRETHGPRFQRMAARICATYGFDPSTF